MNTPRSSWLSQTQETVIHSASGSNLDPSRIVIKPKLQAPLPRPEQLARPKLFELLRKTLDCKVTLVSAPAGYGKTTLLAQWHRAEEANLPFAWVSLDEHDNDPVRLWRHIVEAVRRHASQEVPGTDVLFGMSAAGLGPVEMSLPIFINELAELPHRMVVVLDDYQFVTEDRCHRLVGFFVDHLPQNVHFVISSRSDPSLPLGRWRARREMNEIRTEQLAFSEEEISCLLNEKMGLRIGRDDLSVLLEHTEGWPAAIYLASLPLQNKDNKHVFIESFGGSNRYIVDLLGEEVMASLPEETREFLLRTSILKRMTASVCDAVVGRKGSGQLLRELARSNLFVVPLDEQGEWYRYHYLFCQFLLNELENGQPELIPHLHNRASAWLEDAGFFEEAIWHAIAATDHERAGTLIGIHWYGYVTAGQTKTVERWLEALPEELTTHDPALLIVRAWVCTLSGRSEEAKRLLDLAESIPYEGPLPDGTPSVEAGAATLRAVFGLGGIQSSLEAARLAAALDSERTSPWTTLIGFGLGSSLYLSGERSMARKQFESVIELTEAGQPLLRMVSLSYLSIIATDEGHLEEAELFECEARVLVERFGLQGVPQSSWVPIALGYMLAKRGDLAEAQTELESGLSVRRKLPDLSPWPTLIGLLTLASVRSARGDRAGSRAVLAEARAILEPFADDAGVFPEILKHQELKLRKSKQRDGSLDGELTERELDVLRLLVGELSIRHIAQSLYVAPSTVKTHVKSIYRKLGVSSRGKAVDEARAREII